VRVLWRDELSGECVGGAGRDVGAGSAPGRGIEFEGFGGGEGGGFFDADHLVQLGHAVGVRSPGWLPTRDQVFAGALAVGGQGLLRKVDNLHTPARLGEFDPANRVYPGWLRQAGLAERTAR
jgi:hypothetical protein